MASRPRATKPGRRHRALAAALLAWMFLLGAPQAALAWHETYLALGDSLAFGFNQATFNLLDREADPAAENPVDFDRGYVDDLGHELAAYVPGIEIVNDGCPGETSYSFIRGPCEYGLTYRLHHAYWRGRRTAQLQDAVHYLRTHAGRVSLLTLDIGGNDALEVIYACKGASACIGEREPALVAQVSSNLHRILAKLRSADRGGTIILLGLYNPFGASIADAREVIARLNVAEAAQAVRFGAGFADPLPEFNPSGTAEPETICRLVNVCGELGDVHPTYAGYAAMAELLLARYLAR